MKRLLFVMLSAFSVFAFDGPGTSDFAVLRISHDARAIAMGEAFTALAEGVYGLYWNPAGIADISSSEFLIGYHALPVDVNGGIPAYAKQVNRKYGIGIAAQYINCGKFDEIDEYNQNTGASFTPFSFIGIIGAGKKFTNKFSAGLSFKGVYEKIIDGYASKGAGVDVGVRYLPDIRRIGLAAVVQNIGANSFNKEFTLPLTIKLGATNIFSIFPKTRFAFDIVKPVEDEYEYRIGAEYRQSRNLFVRAGFCETQPELERIAKHIIQKKNFSDAPERAQSWSVGAGYKTSAFTIDYALQSWDLLGFTHAVSLLFPF